jgi:23S rRNA (adenine2030-N6)-methyltransferase
LRQHIKRPVLMFELSIYPETITTHLNGCGMIIINPPYRLDSDVKILLAWLWRALSPAKQGGFAIHHLST